MLEKKTLTKCGTMEVSTGSLISSKGLWEFDFPRCYQVLSTWQNLQQ